MGYWSEHPMGGDSPQDDLYMVYEKVFGTIDTFEISDEDKDKMVEAFFSDSSKIDDLIYATQNLSCTFVTAFFIAGYGKIVMPKLTQKQSETIKNLIGDGRGAERGYESTDNPSPQVYANELKDAWADLEHRERCDFETPMLFDKIMELGL